MEFIAAGAAWALQKPPIQKVLKHLGIASLVASNGINWSSLEVNLSPNASVVFPTDSAFIDLTSRWREWHGPSVGAVVTVHTETDVQETVRFANEEGLTFLAKVGAHGATEALASARDTILIDLQNLNSVELSPSGDHAIIGGGIKVKQVVNDLWGLGKQTVTGICECVGFSAPALGGGHGWLQGQYGLAADQVVSARVVLPNGDIVKTSESENLDLFWALRGAGHNFGIVTEWEYKVYDIRNPKWSYEIFILPGNKLESLLELTNTMMLTQPPHVTHWIYIVNIPEIDPDHPVIWYAIIYDGPSGEARDYAEPLHGLGPLNVNAGELPMPELASVTMMNEDGVGCSKGFTGLRFPIDLQTYNIPAVRKVYDEIDETTHRIPELSGCFFLLEGYSVQGVQAIDEASTAFPHRGAKILVTSYIMYSPNPALDEPAREFGEKLRRYLLEASDDPEHLNSYVNYAHGTEPLEAMYGWEQWRLDKLKNLKNEWDPENRMRFYAPIV